MAPNKLILCTRCGRRQAFAEADWIRFAEQGGPPTPPPIPAGVCLACGFKDPQLREPLRDWSKELGAWGEQRMQQHFRQLRELIARPLEAIDRFVDSFR